MFDLLRPLSVTPAAKLLTDSVHGIMGRRGCRFHLTPSRFGSPACPAGPGRRGTNVDGIPSWTLGPLSGGRLRRPPRAVALRPGADPAQRRAHRRHGGPRHLPGAPAELFGSARLAPGGDRHVVGGRPAGPGL